MKYGVFLSKRKPEEGGGYTITEELFNSLIKLIRRKKYNANFFFLISNDYDGKISNLLKKNKIKYQIIYENLLLKKIIIFLSHYFNKINRILNYFNIININNIFEKENCDKILFISSEYREKLNLPYIATVWDMQHETHPNFKEVSSYGKYLYKRVVNNNFIKNSNTVIVGTKAGKKEIIKFTKFKKKILILPHPVSRIFIDYKNKKKNRSEKYFFYPANFWEHKNHENLLKGFKLFLKYNKNFNLILSGDKKNYYYKIKKLIDDLELTKKVKIVGHIKLKKLLSLYDNCDAVVYVSFSGPENLPPLEALARGKKLINSKYPGSKEQLKNFPIYIDPYSPNDIAKGMIKVTKIKRPPNYKYLGKYIRSKNSKVYIEKLLSHLIN